ncbi:beta-N-acetylhexosaminidase [Arhodomonas aquaeolei]|uniref:beta-N-acetylhexosaminidase n=1 Tax=Arhodomonas aquaeolei TaxID=2369 RepID=UPI0003766BB6|nr:beta-N-acetylhexosaminidase [Arhodomonas aquaeolei]MCS4503290.1 beta-N-acetylhexosaminidase [Arhodomonas aquaeolei]
MSLGPLMIGIEGLTLTGEERRRLRDPAVGGVILFRRNFADADQLAALTADIRSLRAPPLLVATDHEGGRVQRFTDGFTRLPAQRGLGRLWQREPAEAEAIAEQLGWLGAAELLGVGVDLGLGPVVDIDHGMSTVIGDRALADTPRAVTALSAALVRGMRRAGMAAVAKHFPGHGGVRLDSHEALPEDPRDSRDLHDADLVPFRRLIMNGLEAVMMAHIVFPAEDRLPASLSRHWIGTILRGRLGFQGAVISDDLSMAGAAVAGGLRERVRTALGAGSDMVIIGNEGRAVDAVLPDWHGGADAAAALRRARLHGRHAPALKDLHASRDWRRAREAAALLER